MSSTIHSIMARPKNKDTEMLKKQKSVKQRLQKIMAKGTSSEKTREGHGMKTIAMFMCIILVPSFLFALDMNDDGHEWCKSNETDKMKVAEEIGFRFKTPTVFWFEIFESYYNTDKPERLNKPIVDVAFEQAKPQPGQPPEAYEKPKKEILEFSLIMDSTQSGPTVKGAGNGLGEFTLNTKTCELIYYIEYRGLSSPEKNSNICGPAEPGKDAKPLLTLRMGNSKSGRLWLTNIQKDKLLKGLLYVNISTGDFPEGEIRGQIKPK